MPEHYTITIYRDDAVLYQGRDWYAVDEVIRIGDRITMPCGVDVTYLGGFSDDDSDDDTTVCCETEYDNESDNEDVWGDDNQLF